MTTLGISVKPAYGRDYRSRKAAQDDWEAGKDFRIYGPTWQDGRYVNINDLPAGTSVQFRYDRMSKSFAIRTGKADTACSRPDTGIGESGIQTSEPTPLTGE